jgi:hypothetical protein
VHIARSLYLPLLQIRRNAPAQKLQRVFRAVRAKKFPQRFSVSLKKMRTINPQLQTG